VGYLEREGFSRARLTSRRVRDAAVRARQPIGQTPDRFIQGRAVEGHQGSRPAVRIEHLRPPSLGGDLGDLDAVLAAIDLLCQTMKGDSQGRELSQTESLF
jgi:hypothetical protein